MRPVFIAGTMLLAGLAVAGAIAQPATQGNAARNSGAPADDTQRLNDEAAARLRQQIEARQRVIDQNDATRRRIEEENARRQREYEEQMRARDAAIAAERARYDAEMERFRAQQAAGGRQNAQRGGGSTSQSRANAERTTPSTAARRTSSASAGGRTCAQQVQRNRQRGRAVGGALGGIAGVVGGRSLGTAARVGLAAVAIPVGALIGDAIASRLDCHEQEQAAQATEQAVAGGVGTTISWRSETRPNVTGTSTVTAIEAPVSASRNSPVSTTGTPTNASGTAATSATLTAAASPDSSPCLTVTDVIIVDGEETRAPKRMCRRPPTNRFVRV